VYFSIQDQLR